MDLSPGLSYFVGQLDKLFLSAGSDFSLTSLAMGLAFASLFVAWRRWARGRKPRWRSVLRALFPRALTTSPSTGVDLGFLFFQVYLNSLLFGWAILSFDVLSHAVVTAFTASLGPSSPTIWSSWAVRGATTLALFLAYDLGYWFNHYLNHRIPVLWEFHRVHHSAEVLTPLTNFRVHPLYTIVFANILVLFTGATSGAMTYAFGQTAEKYAVWDSNLILVVFVHTYVHLQHSHLWIPFRGWLGHLFISPAHHQVHHSTNPLHFNKNMGSCLAVWDWAFGTLHVPSKEREVTGFGTGDCPLPHTIYGMLFMPVMRAARLTSSAASRRFVRVSPQTRTNPEQA